MNPTRARPHPLLGAVALCGLASLTACPGPRDAVPASYSISGTVSVNLPALASAAPQGQRLEPQGGELSGIVPGRVIVRFKPRAANGLTAQALSSLSVASPGGPDVQLERERPLALSGTHVYTAPGLDAAGTAALAETLQARDDVAFAFPDRMVQPLKTPNDTHYPKQWNLQPWSPSLPGALNLPAAWDISTGVPGTVIAILDTGLLYDHPEFAGRTLPGYDFISTPASGNDNDGRDPSAEDSGDEPKNPQTANATYHGTHVAGIVGAASDNGAGVTGVNWGAKLLPVRILGVQGGLESDLADAIVWAAGGPVPGVPNNPNPASVMNLSLGVVGLCNPAVGAAMLQARAQPQRPVIVVAAGNGGVDGLGDNAAFTSPANCAGAVVVGATDQRGERTEYSNHGPTVSVMAPGGDATQPYKDQENGGSVLSTWANDDARKNNTFDLREYKTAYSDGTSMAAPHIAGLVGLLKGLRPTLNTAEALAVLRATARPLSGAACRQPDGCGAGLPDAAAALARVRDNLIPPGLEVTLDSTTLRLRPGQTGTVNATLERAGGYADTPALTATGAPPGVTVSFNVAGDAATVKVALDGSAEGGAYPIVVRTPTGGTATLNLLVEGVKGALVRAVPIGVTGRLNLSKAVTTVVNAGNRTGSYTVAELEPAVSYVVFAWQDLNVNGEVDDGDFLGAYTKDGINLAQSTAPSSGININLEPYSGLAATRVQQTRSVFSDR